MSGDNVVSKIKHDTNRVLINETQYFEGISEEVWDFRIGSYKVLEKYLASRKGRKLEIDELEHFIQIIEVIGRTIQIRKQIDNEFGPYL